MTDIVRQVAMVVYSGKHYKREVYKWNFAKSNAEFKRIVNNVRAIGGTTATSAALDVAYQLMEERNKTIPSLIMIVTDGGSQDDPKEAAGPLRDIPNTWLFAAATGDPNIVER